jgi:hypothetical protein
MPKLDYLSLLVFLVVTGYSEGAIDPFVGRWIPCNAVRQMVLTDNIVIAKRDNGIDSGFAFIELASRFWGKIWHRDRQLDSLIGSNLECDRLGLRNFRHYRAICLHWKRFEGERIYQSSGMTSILNTYIDWVALLKIQFAHPAEYQDRPNLSDETVAGQLIGFAGYFVRLASETGLIPGNSGDDKSGNRDGSLEPKAKILSNLLAILFILLAVAVWIYGGWQIYRSRTWRPWFSFAIIFFVFGLIHLGLWFAFGR